MAVSDQAILDYIAANPGAGREDIRRHAARDVSETTVWRALKRLVDDGLATAYTDGGVGNSEFQQGNAGVVTQGTWMIAPFVAALKSATRLDLSRQRNDSYAQAV